MEFTGMGTRGGGGEEGCILAFTRPARISKGGRVREKLSSPLFFKGVNNTDFGVQSRPVAWLVIR
ncbi:hypothetical protein J6590_074655 [Homalodisca vitripennis]|nr:hypothetical protein J6590_074655 [Homalodisca vitripennis]